MNSNLVLNAGFNAVINSEDYINTKTFFGGIKKNIISGNFKGGKIQNIFGATELDFTHANISGIVTLDFSQAFGETKITVPADWTVEFDLERFLSGVDDRRKYNDTGLNKNKVLVLEGLSICAGITIKTCGA